MTGILIFLAVFSLLLGLFSGYHYLMHPLAGTKYVQYVGGKFWLFSFVCFIIVYLKG